MNSIIFYSILLFIIISIFMPSIYNYCYSSFVGRILIIILILYFSKQNIFLGLIFITLVITYSYPLYEGFNIGTISLATNNTKPNNPANKYDLFNYYNEFYCSDPNKVNQWNTISANLNNKYTNDEVVLANYNLNNYTEVCINNGMYESNIQQTIYDQESQGQFGWLSGAFQSVINFGSNIAGQGNAMGNTSNIDGCSYNGQDGRYVYYTPECLLENNSSFMCNDISPGSQIYQSAQTVSNNTNLSNRSQQEAQYIINTQNWICQ